MKANRPEELLLTIDVKFNAVRTIFLFCEDNLDCNPKKKLKARTSYSSFCLHRTNIEKKCNIITVKPWCCLWIKHTSFLSNSESIYRWTIYLIFCVLNWSCIKKNSSVSVSLVKYLSIFEKYIAIELSTVTREKNSFHSEIESESFTWQKCQT